MQSPTFDLIMPSQSEQLAGFIMVGTAVLGAAGGLFSFCWLLYARSLPKQSRDIPGKCRCGYSLAGLPAGTRCPECGHDQVYRLSPPTLRQWTLIGIGAFAEYACGMFLLYVTLADSMEALFFSVLTLLPGMTAQGFILAAAWGVLSRKWWIGLFAASSFALLGEVFVTSAELMLWHPGPLNVIGLFTAGPVFGPAVVGMASFGVVVGPAARHAIASRRLRRAERAADLPGEGQRQAPDDRGTLGP